MFLEKYEDVAREEKILNIVTNDMKFIQMKKIKYINLFLKATRIR